MLFIPWENVFTFKFIFVGAGYMLHATCMGANAWFVLTFNYTVHWVYLPVEES